METSFFGLCRFITLEVPYLHAEKFNENSGRSLRHSKMDHKSWTEEGDIPEPFGVNPGATISILEGCYLFHVPTNDTYMGSSILLTYLQTFVILKPDRMFSGHELKTKNWQVMIHRNR